MKLKLLLIFTLIAFVFSNCSKDSGDNFVVGDVADDDPDDDDNGETGISDRVLFVNLLSGGSNDGSDWDNAFNNLQDAINESLAGDEIWVAQGVYITTETTDRKVSFVMKDSVKIYGGFSGVETMLEERDWITNQTILSGEIGDPNTVDDNSYNVVQNTTNELTNEAVLDGFGITLGNAGDPEPFERGGGMFNKNSSPTIQNCVFYNNYGQYGAGIYNLGGSSPKITNCVFINNLSTKGGGGVYNFLNASPEITNCIISGNECQDQYGGGVYNFQSDPIFINTVITGNKATLGGGMYSTNESDPILINVTMAGNFANQFGGGIYNVTSTTELINSIVWNNADSNGLNGPDNSIYNDRSDYSSSYSLIHSMIPETGDGNLDGMAYGDDSIFEICGDPYESATTTGDYNLKTDSPAINAGNNSANTTQTDISGGDRVIGGVIDLGAFEN